MSYLSLLKSLPNNLRQPAGIAFIASVGVHGLVGVTLPLLSPAEIETPDRQQRVQVIELSPDQQKRLPSAVLPQPQTATVPVPGGQYSPNWLGRRLPSNRTPGYSLTPLPSLGYPFRLPGGYNPYRQSPNVIAINPLAQGAPMRQPPLGQQPTQRPANSPLFDDSILSRNTSWSTAWNNITPDSTNLQIAGKPTPSSSPSPQDSPASPSASPLSSASPRPSPTSESLSPITVPSPSSEVDPNLLSFNAAGTSREEAAGELGKWLTELQANGVGADSPNSWQPLPIKVKAPSAAKSIVEKAERPIKVVLGVVVDGEGKLVSDPTLIQKSGYPLLDTAALEEAKNYSYSATGASVPYLITLEFTP
ncbi:MAG: energy transducer TonB [Cyanobacteria bacterium]|nr:energy transducer TonB [Cyanobacteriota bacterium]MDW8199719.1 hypothetical protein [Cyanobacteriota bacterium SKYGB_h_bin112]